MSVASSLGGNPLSFAAGETLGPQFRDLSSALDNATRGLKGFTPALMDVTSAVKGFAAAASPNGMKPLSQAFDLLAASVGSVLLPGLVLLAAGVSVAAIEIHANLKPKMKEVAEWYAKHIDYFVKFSSSLVSATEGLMRFAGNLPEKLGKSEVESGNRNIGAMAAGGLAGGITAGTYIGAAAGPVGAILGTLIGFGVVLKKEHDQDVKAHQVDAALEAKRLAGPHARNEVGVGGPPPPGAAGGAGVPGWMGMAIGAANLIQQNLPKKANPDELRLQKILNVADMMANGMQAAMGGDVGFGGIADKWKKAQQASFQDQMEAEKRKIQQDTITSLKDLIAELRKLHPRPVAPNPVVGAFLNWMGH